MILEIIAIAMICAGIYLILKGLSEEAEVIERPELYGFEGVEERRPKRDVKAGGVVLIGPIPIVFGESRMAVYALILTIILIILVLLLMFVPYYIH